MSSAWTMTIIESFEYPNCCASVGPSAESGNLPKSSLNSFGRGTRSLTAGVQIRLCSSHIVCQDTDLLSNSAGWESQAPVARQVDGNRDHLLDEKANYWLISVPVGLSRRVATNPSRSKQDVCPTMAPRMVLVLFIITLPSRPICLFVLGKMQAGFPSSPGPPLYREAIMFSVPSALHSSASSV